MIWNRVQGDLQGLKIASHGIEPDFFRLQQCAQVVDDLVFGQSAREAIYKLAVFEHKHCRDALDLIFGSQARALIQVDFCEFYKSAVLRGELVHNRQQESAMAAPWRPEKHQHGAGKPDDFGVEYTFVYVDGVFGIGCRDMKRRATLAADSPFSET